MKLSKNLSLHEVVRSNTAKRLGIDNTPNEEQIRNLKILAENIFQPTRDHFGVRLHISSGFRSRELNSYISNSSTISQHTTGEAIDIDQDYYNNGVSNADVFNYIKENLQFDQLIWEHGDDSNPAWVHVSFNALGNQRNRILRAKKNGRKTSYTIM
jgi:zinc D-Ala-D-Ala carboxypeptidase